MVADDLSRENVLLNCLDVQVPGLESLRDLYANGHDFVVPYVHCKEGKG